MFQKIYKKIIQKQLQMRMIKKYLKKKGVSPEEKQEITDEG